MSRGSLLLSALLLPVVRAARILPGHAVSLEESDRWFESHCPAGLGESGTPEHKICTRMYATKGGSDMPLTFSMEGEIRIEAQFLDELSTYLEDEIFVGNILADCKATQMRKEAKKTHNETLEKEAEHEESSWETFKHEYHESEERLEPLHFIAHHFVEHEAIHVLVEGAAALAEASEAAALVGGHGIAAMGLETLSAGALGLEIAGEAVLTGLSLPVVIVPQVLYMLYQFHENHNFRSAHARGYVRKLVMNAQCVQKNLTNASFELNERVGAICGNKSTIELESQLHKTKKAMINMFHTLADLGHCTYPHGKRAWSKLNCAEKLYPKMYEHGGEPGMMDKIFRFAGSYAKEANKLVKKPLYGDWFDMVLGINVTALPSTNKEKSAEEMENESNSKKMTSCVSLLATHKAFEATFNRIAASIPVYTGTFARGVHQVSLLTSAYPCRRVFHAVNLQAAEEQEKKTDLKPGEKEKDEETWGEPADEAAEAPDSTDGPDASNLCKHYDFFEGYGSKEHAIDESDPCGFNITNWELGLD